MMIIYIISIVIYFSISINNTNIVQKKREKMKNNNTWIRTHDP